MAIRKKTLRKMSIHARKVARLTNELQSITRRLRGMIGTVQELEITLEAFKLDQQQRKKRKKDSNEIDFI